MEKHVSMEGFCHVKINVLPFLCATTSHTCQAIFAKYYFCCSLVNESCRLKVYHTKEGVREFSGIP